MPNRVESRYSGRVRRPPTGGAGATAGIPLRWGPHQAGKPANAATLRFLLSLLTPEPEARGEVQWIRAERLLAIHRLGPLALASERVVGGGLLPRSVARRLEAGYLSARQATLRSIETGEAIGEAFRAEGIPYLRFGGLALVCEGVYGDPGARPVDGLKLLVSRHAADRAARSLRALGFEPEATLGSPPLQSFGSIGFRSSDGAQEGGMKVELSWSVGPSPTGGTLAGEEDACFWVGAESGTGFPAPAPHLALLVERLVAGIGDRSYLRRLADVGRLIPRVESWERFLRVAEPRPYAAGVGLLLRVLEEETGAPVPRGVIRTLGGSKVGLRPIAARVRPSILLQRGIPGPGLSSELFRRGALLSAPARALRAAAATIWPSEGWLRDRFAEPHSPLRRLRVRHLVALVRRSSPLTPWREG